MELSENVRYRDFRKLRPKSASVTNSRAEKSYHVVKIVPGVE